MSLEGGKEVGRRQGRGLLTWADSLEESQQHRRDAAPVQRQKLEAPGGLVRDQDGT